MIYTNYIKFNDILKRAKSEIQMSQRIISSDMGDITFGEFQEKIQSYTWALLELGISKGTPVGYCLPNCPEIFYLICALNQIGAITVPIHPQMPSQAKIGILARLSAPFIITISNMVKEMAAVLDQMHLSEKIVIITLQKNENKTANIEDTLYSYRGEKPEIPSVQPDDTSMLISSSGSTGIPKFVAVSQKNMAAVVKATYPMVEPIYEGDEPLSTVVAFPLCTSAVFPCISILLLGQKLILMNDFSPRTFFSLIDKHKATAIAGPPGYLQNVVYFPDCSNYRLQSVRRIFSGMDFLPNSSLQSLRRRFPNINRVAIGYGLAETCTMVLAWIAEKEEDFETPTRIVSPLKEVDNKFKIVDKNDNEVIDGESGELCIRGESVVNGYYHNETETKKAFRNNGWLYTGDRASKNKNGRIQLLGREKFAIKRGGRTVSPITIGEHLTKKKGVLEAAVIGVPHELYGEMIWAYVRSDKKQNITTGELSRHCREGLPSYMVADVIRITDSIPKTKAGKIDNAALIENAKKELDKMNGGKNG
ncbi:MAG: class I adenylate-forming enzyme family protein [Chitinispirillia bacterium]|jgi:long-chain acyl-CoA synthetase